MIATKLTLEQREEIAKAKSSVKQLKKKNRVHYMSMRDDIIRSVLNAKTPSWGNLRLTVTKNGI